MDVGTPNPRNFYGIFIFLFGLGLYAFLVAAGGDALNDYGLHASLQMLYFAIFGIIWIFPAKKFFDWMAKGRSE